MAVTSGRVEIAVKVTDQGQSKAVEKLNKDLKQAEKSSVGAEKASAGWAKSLLGGAEAADGVKNKFSMITGIIPGIAAGIAAVGATVAIVGEAIDAITGPSKYERMQGAIRVGLDAAKQTHEEIKSLADEVRKYTNEAYASRIKLLRLTGDDTGADRLEQARQLDAIQDKGRQRAITLARLEAERDAARAMALITDARYDALKEERQSEIVGYQNVIKQSMKEGLSYSEAVNAVLGEELVTTVRRAQQEKNASDGNLAALDKQISALKAIDDQHEKRVAWLEKARALEATITSARMDGLRAQQSAASGIVSLLTQAGAQGAQLREAQRTEFDVKKQLGLIELDAAKGKLAAEIKSVEAAQQQLAIYYAIQGISLEVAAKMAQQAATLEQLQGGVTAIDKQRDLLAASRFKGGTGGGTTPTPLAGRFTLAGGTNRPISGPANAAPALILDPSVGATLARYVQGESEIVRQLNELETTQARERARILGEYDAAVANASAARTAARDALATLADASTGAVGGEVGTLLAEQQKQRGALSDADKAVTAAEAAKQDALTALAEEGAQARAEIARSETAAQLAAYSQIASGMQTAFASIQGVGSATQDFFQATISLAKGVADHWSDIEAGKSGVISAITAEAAASIKSKKAQYALQSAGYAAEAVVAFARYDYGAGALYLLGSGMFAAAAGSAGGGGTKGRAPARAPSVRPSDIGGAAGAIIFNINAPWIGSNPQEMARYLAQTSATAAGTGMA